MSHIDRVLRLLIGAVMLSCVPVSVSADNEALASLSWTDAIRAGVAHHPLIQLAQHQMLGTEAATKQLEAANYPQVTAVWQNTGGNTRVLANLSVSGSLPKPVNYMTTPGIRVDYLITDFGYTAHSVLANKALADAEGKDILTVKALIILNVEQAFLNCLKQQRIVDTTRDLFKQWQFIATQAETYYGKQLRAKLDFDVATVAMKQAELNLLKAENDLRSAFVMLNTAMGRSSVTPYRLEAKALTTNPLPPLETLLEKALSLRPEIQGSQDRLRAAEEAIRAVKALRFGNIGAIGTAGYSWWGHEERPSGKDVSNPGAQLGFWGAGGTSAFPIYTGGRIEGKIDQAQARSGELRATGREIGNDVVLQVAQAYFTQQTVEEQIRVAQARAEHAREALMLARERYKQGLGSILDITTATAALTGAEVGLAEAQYESEASFAALKYATGEEYAQF